MSNKNIKAVNKQGKEQERAGRERAGRAGGAGMGRGRKTESENKGAPYSIEQARAIIRYVDMFYLQYLLFLLCYKFDM